MSIQTTETITRADAIDRIKHVCNCISEKDYRRLEQTSSESNNVHSLESFINSEIHPRDVTKWTNTMLANLLDRPYWRRSQFENYLVID